MSEQQSATLLELTMQIITAHSSANPVDPDVLPELIQAVYRSLASVGGQYPVVDRHGKGTLLAG